MKMRRVITPVLALALVMFAACDKDDNNNSSSSVNGSDSAFTVMASLSNYAEISAAKFADSVSTDPDVREFADKMILDHGKARDSMRQIATSLGLRAPDSLSATQAAVAMQLHMLTGRAFDSAYIFTELTGHVETIGLLNSEKTNGNNSSLKKYVDTYLPPIQMHYDMADTLSKKY